MYAHTVTIVYAQMFSKANNVSTTSMVQSTCEQVQHEAMATLYPIKAQTNSLVLFSQQSLQNEVNHTGEDCSTTVVTPAHARNTHGLLTNCGTVLSNYWDWEPSQDQTEPVTLLPLHTHL